VGIRQPIIDYIVLHFNALLFLTYLNQSHHIISLYLVKQFVEWHEKGTILEVMTRIIVRVKEGITSLFYFGKVIIVRIND